MIFYAFNLNAKNVVKNSLFVTKEINGTTYSDVLCKFENKNVVPEFEKIGGTICFMTNNFFSGKIPTDSLSAAYKIDGLIISKSVNVDSKMKTVRDTLYVDQVHNGIDLSSPYKGDGVIVGIIDNGFDYSHLNFRDSSLDLRIGRVWEQKIEGTPPLIFDYGNEVTNKNLIRELGTDNEFGKNGEQHGTHVAGIAAGSSLLSSKYVGIAPNSELVFVSTDMTNKGIFDGIAYIFDYAESQNKPCVINISIGGHFGPHDGTSIFDLATKELIGEGKIIVGSAGNEGNDFIHLSSVNSSENELITFVSDKQGKPQVVGSIDIWGEFGQPIDIQVGIYDINDAEFEDFIDLSFNEIETSGDSVNMKYKILKDFDTFFPDEVPVQFNYEVNPLNNKPHIFVQFDNTQQDDNFKPIYLFISSPSKNIHAWNINSSRFFNYGLNVNNGDNSYTVGEIGGTGEGIISVGALNNQNHYIDANGYIQNSPYQGSIGERAIFSSKGPTVDNRIKPDVSAPGNVIASSFNEYYPAVSENPNLLTDIFQHNRIPNKKYYFGVMQGTSMSAPVITGTIALLLEQNPKLTKDEIMKIFRDESFQQANNEVGLGLLNVYNMIKRNDIVTFNNETISDKIIVFPNPSSGTINIQSNDEYVIFNTIGNIVYKGFESRIQLEKGFYILKSNGKTQKIIIE